jgi:hypothetical protein
MATSLTALFRFESKGGLDYVDQNLVEVEFTNAK